MVPAWQVAQRSREVGASVSALVVNFFGGPGTGKSTTAAAVFALLKQLGVNCELALEYAKDKVWERSLNVLANQIYVFAQQHHRIWRLLDQVDVVITDSPLLLSLHYGSVLSESFKQLVLEEHRKLRSFNVMLVRQKPYEQAGRLQTEEQARLVDQALLNILMSNGIDFGMIDCSPGVEDELAAQVLSMLRSESVAQTDTAQGP